MFYGMKRPQCLSSIPAGVPSNSPSKHMDDLDSSTHAGGMASSIGSRKRKASPAKFERDELKSGVANVQTGIVKEEVAARGIDIADNVTPRPSIQSPMPVQVKQEYFSDNSASLPGISGGQLDEFKSPIGFEPGMFKREVVMLQGLAGNTPTSSSTASKDTLLAKTKEANKGGSTHKIHGEDATVEVKKKKKDKKKHSHKHKHRHKHKHGGGGSKEKGVGWEKVKSGGDKGKGGNKGSGDGGGKSGGASKIAITPDANTSAVTVKKEIPGVDANSPGGSTFPMGTPESKHALKIKEESLSSRSTSPSSEHAQPPDFSF